ncbi:MAG: tetratricopeptide repeat protein, partial [Spirochaetia bacterium]|nr:tetratricopeptide repeat protein [Spirochaetia bacterium]
TEAYLRTTGWSNYVNVWYLYFRKVNFPADPEIHGRWEWAGIYYGEKL